MTETENAEAGPHPYFLAIEDVFLDLRGSPLQVSSADWQLAKEWYEQGIPLELVERTVREVFARRAAREDRKKKQKVWSLRYCKRSVEAAWRRQQELQAPGAAAEEEELDLSSRLANLASSLPPGLAQSEEIAGRIRALEGDAEVIETRLTELDQEIVRRAREGLSAAEIEGIERELAVSRTALAARLPAAELERAQRRLREEVLRRRLSLPVLSLFAPEAMAPGKIDP